MGREEWGEREKRRGEGGIEGKEGDKGEGSKRRGEGKKGWRGVH